MVERAISVEERIRRAEEIYEKRRQGESRPITKVNVNNTQKKDIKLLKKMIIQILVCISIYLVIYAIYNNKYVFSEDFIKKANEILSYDTNFGELYQNAKNQLETWFKAITTQEEGQEQTENTESENQAVDEQNAIGGASGEEIVQDITTQGEINEQEQSQTAGLSQTEQDIQNVKNTTTFIKPVEGTISSSYGRRETATGSVPKDHTGTDIAAPMGTKIKSATDGEVVLVSEEGDYGKHIKIQIGEVSIIYAHCNQLYVKQGDIVTQGQEIAEVGSTGNSTGPHLHFEIRYSERTVDSQSILEL